MSADRRKRGQQVFLGNPVLHVILNLPAHTRNVAILFVVSLFPAVGVGRKAIDVLENGFLHMFNVPLSHWKTILH